MPLTGGENKPQLSPWWLVIDKSLAVALLSVVLWLGFRWHTHVMTDTLQYFKDQNSFFREQVIKHLDEINRKLDRDHK